MDISYKITADTAQFQSSIHKSVEQLNELRQSGNMTADDLNSELQKIGKAAAAGGLKNTADNVQSFNDALMASGLSAAEAATAVSAFTSEAQSIAEGTDQAAESMSWLDKQFEGLKEGADGMANPQAVIAMLPAPIQGVAQGALGMLTTFKTLAKTPLLMVIQAITWAFQQLSGFMTSTTSAGSEGFDDLERKGQAVNKVIAKFEAVLATVANIGYRVAEALYNAFDNPKQAAIDLWATIKSVIVNHLEAVGNMFKALGGIIKSALKLDGNGITASFENLKTAMNDVLETSPFGVIRQQVKDLIDETNDLSAQIEEIKNREQALRIARAKWQSKEANLNVGIRSMQEQIAEEENLQKKLEAIDKVQGLIAQKYAQQIKFAREELAIKEMANNPTASSAEDLEEVERLKAQLISLEAEQKAEGMRFTKMRASILKQQASAELKAQQEITDMLADQQERRLQLERDSMSKSIALINLRKNADLEALKARKKAWEEEGRAMDERTKAAFDAEEALINQQAEADTKNTLATTYTTFATQLKTLSEKYTKDIALLQSNGMTDEARVADNQRIQEIGSAAESWITSGLASEGTLRALQDFETRLGEMTGEALIAKITEVEEALKNVEGMSPDQIALLYAELTKLKAKAREAKKELNGGMTEEAKKRLMEFADSAGEVGESIAELGDTFGGTFREAARVINQCAELAKTLISTITTITTESAKLMQSTAKTAAEEIKGVERASVILAIISAALQAAQAIAKLFKDDDTIMQEIRNDVEQYREALRDLRIEKDLLNDVDTVWGDDAFGGFINSVMDATKYLNKFYDKVAEMGKTNIAAIDSSATTLLPGVREALSLDNITKSADASLSSVQRLAKGIESISIVTKKGNLFRKSKHDSVGNLFGSLVGETDEDTMNKLKEFAKGDTFKKLSKEQQNAVSDMIADWDAYQEALDQEVAALSNWFGGMADAWGDAIVEAFENGTDAAETFAKSVGDILNDFGKQLMQSLFLSQVLEDAQAEVKELVASDEFNGMTNEERGAAISKIAVKTADVLNDRMEDAEQFYKTWTEGVEKAGYATDKAKNANTLSGAIAGASQESIDLLSGYCNAVRIQQVESLDVMRQQLVAMSGVENNTAVIASNTRQILDYMQGTTTEDMSLRASGL